MHLLSRRQWLALGGLGLFVCAIWTALLVVILFQSGAPATDRVAAIAPTPSVRPSPTPVPASITPDPPATATPVLPRPTATLVVQPVTPTPRIQRTVSARQLIAKVALELRPEDMRISVDARHIATLYTENKRWYVLVDGKKQKAYEAIDRKSLQFSADGKHFAYVATAAGKQFVVVDGKEGTRYDKVTNVVYSPDGKRMAYVGKRGTLSFAIVDGKEGGHFDTVGPVIFSPDSRNYAYAIKALTPVGYRESLVYNGSQMGVYESIDRPPVFSPNSQRVAYVAKDEGKWHVYVDWKPGKAYGEIHWGGPVFSPNSQRLAYVGRVPARTVSFGLPSPIQPVAFQSPVPLQCVAVIDGKEDRSFDCIQIDSLRFSPDSKRFTYVGYLGTKEYVVVDGQRTSLYMTVSGSGVHFSSDSQRTAYWAWPDLGDSAFLVVDGEPGTRYDKHYAGNPFSPDGKRVAYPAERGGRAYGVVDGNELGPYQEISDGVVFSPDSRHTAFVGVRAYQSVVVVDGNQLPLAEEYIQAGAHALEFDSNDTLHYLIGNIDGYYRIEEKIR